MIDKSQRPTIFREIQKAKFFRILTLDVSTFIFDFYQRHCTSITAAAQFNKRKRAVSFPLA